MKFPPFSILKLNSPFLLVLFFPTFGLDILPCSRRIARLSNTQWIYTTERRGLGTTPGNHRRQTWWLVSFGMLLFPLSKGYCHVFWDRRSWLWNKFFGFLDFSCRERLECWFNIWWVWASLLLWLVRSFCFALSWCSIVWFHFFKTNKS